jgi:hypothetical protein
MAVKMFILIFWVVTQCSLVGSYQGFRAKLVTTYNTFSALPFEIQTFLLR